MRALQQLRDGKLTIRAASRADLNSVSIDPAGGYSVREVTAKILIDNRWVELKGFSPREGAYRLSSRGKELTEQLCECRYRGRWGRGTHNRPAHDFILLNGTDPVTTARVDWPNQRLLCGKCWRLARCEAKFFKPAHPANRFIWGIGPVCQFHVDNPTKK